MKGVPYLFTVAIMALATTLVSAYDPSPLQDFCVAINNTDSAGMYMLPLFFLLIIIIIFFWRTANLHARSLLAERSSVIITYVLSR